MSSWKVYEARRRMLEATAPPPRTRDELARWLRDDSEPPAVAACPPVVEYSADVRARGVEELELLSEGSAVVEMLRDYALLRNQTVLCQFYQRYANGGAGITAKASRGETAP